MPIAILLWLAEEASAAIVTAGVSASSAISYVADRWWLTAICDFTLRRVTKGKLVMPTSLSHAAAQGANLAWERWGFASADAAYAAVRDALLTPEGRALAQQHYKDISDAFYGQVDPLGVALRFKELLTEQIPKDQKLSQWARTAAAATRLTIDQVLHFRKQFNSRSA